MAISTTEIIKKAKNMELVRFITPMGHHMKANSTKMQFKDKVSTTGKTEKVMKAFGRRTKCMVRELFYILMVVSTKVSSNLTKKAGRVFLNGQMAESTMATGKMTNNMGREHIQAQVATQKKVNFLKVKESNG